MPDINKIINGCKHCITKSGYSYPCHECPYASEDDCTKHLLEDTLSALEWLKFEVQPELPGISSIK